MKKTLAILGLFTVIFCGGAVAANQYEGSYLAD